jgi:hypothetical protein
MISSKEGLSFSFSSKNTNGDFFTICTASEVFDLASMMGAGEKDGIGMTMERRKSSWRILWVVMCWLETDSSFFARSVGLLTVLARSTDLR